MGHRQRRAATVAIENRSLTPGTQLTATYRKTQQRCTVEANADGSLAFVLADGRRFTSPSAAGSAVMGGIACNGWRFWSLVGEASEAVPTDGPVAVKVRATKASTIIKRVPNQKGTPDGQTRWFCSGCMNGFLHPSEEQPTACPEGHSDQPAS
jgi:Restriction Enzyme Adenine Methylase Associated